MADKFTIRQNDTLPDLTATLIDVNGDPVNLTGASIVFKMVARHGASPVVNRAASIVSAADGTVSFAWQAADTQNEGTYYGNFIVTYSGGDIETFPNAEPFVVEIPAEL